MLTPKEVAKILDCEGTIFSGISGAVPYPHVSLGMTDPTYPRIMLEQFGGGLSFTKSIKEAHKDRWHWHVSGRKCEPVLLFALSELLMKKVQAEALLLMVTTVKDRNRSLSSGTQGFQSLSPRDALLRWTLHELVQRLNKKGKYPTVDEVDDVVESLEGTE